MDECLVEAEASETCVAQGLAEGVPVMACQADVDRKPEVLAQRRAADARIVKRAAMRGKHAEGPPDPGPRGLQPVHELRPVIAAATMAAAHFLRREVRPAPGCLRIAPACE